VIPERFKGKGRWSLIVGALLATLTLGAVMAFASGFGATTAFAASSDVVTTTIELNNNEAPAGEDCPDEPGAYWHFVTSPNGGGAAFVEFHLNLGDGTYDIDDFIKNGDQDDNVFVKVPDGKSLDDLLTEGSTADITGSARKFQLSHICVGASETSTLTEVRDGDGNDVTGTALALGAVVHDHAKVEADDSSTPEGTVDFAFYKGTDEAPCSGDAVTNETEVALVNGEADSQNTAALGAGSYGYIVTYHSGDDSAWQDSQGDCEPFTINKAQLTIVTQIHDANHGDVGGSTSVALGSVVHDTATVSGVNPAFPITLVVSFTLNGGAVANDASADGTATARSVDSDPLGAGSYTYAASVAGDSNYEGGVSGDEPLTVDKGTLNIDTLIHDSNDNTVTFVPVLGVVHDTAQLTGATTGFDPTPGNVSFVFYNTLDCTGDSVSKSNIGADAKTGDPRSEDVGPLGSGAYSFQASFANDANYNDAGPSGCEPLSVRTFGKTMGFWGNVNGIAKINLAGGYAANAVNIGRGANVDTSGEAAKILPNQLNACGKGLVIFTVGPQTATAACKLATGININSLNTLAAQTLALGYNIKLVAGFTGQPLSALNCAPVLGLTGASTVNDAFAKAVSLINGSSTGGATTQSQIGLMNTLLGCINAEA
jgi:hypothetical protein